MGRGTDSICVACDDICKIYNNPSSPPNSVPCLYLRFVAVHQLQPTSTLCKYLQMTHMLSSNLPSHSSCYASPQIQQAFPSNPPAKPAREASKWAKQVGDFQVCTLPPLLHIQSHTLIPNHLPVVDDLLNGPVHIPRRLRDPGRTSCFLLYCGFPQFLYY